MTASRFTDTPRRMASLPIDKSGFPVPWFVKWIDGEPEFRVMDERHFAQAVKSDLCWLCGQVLGRHKVFVVGPMCTVNRISAEPPCHRDCAEFAARSCPFLTTPKAVRREGGMPDIKPPPGIMVQRNPGVTALWVTSGYRLVPNGRTGLLFNMLEPTEVVWYAHGRQATRADVDASLETGVPLLAAVAAQEGPEAMRALSIQVAIAQKFLPAA